MKPKAAALKGSLALSDATEASLLRLHERRGHPSDIRGAVSLIRDDPGAVAVWGRLLDEFLDRGAARRLEHYATCYAGHRWKPRLALILPGDFSLRRPSHLRDLAAALEVLAAASDQYHIDVISDSPDAPCLFRRVTPYSRQAIAETAGALVLLSRSLNDAVGAIRPSRYVAADACAGRAEQARIAFTAAGVEVSSRPADDPEILGSLGAGASVFLDEDDGAGSFIDALRRLRAAGLSMRLALSSRADDEFARRVRSAFGGDAQVGSSLPESGLFAEGSRFHISNDPIVLLTQPTSASPIYHFRRGRFWAVDGERSRRSDYYLLRGEESDTDGLLDTWLASGADTRSAAQLRLSRSIEPLVSIVVTVHHETTEILRLARSIYEQDYPWIEVIWVCTGCATETMEAIRVSENYLMKRRFRVRIIELADGADSTALVRDFGIRAASGELACLLDPRDSLGPGFFAFLERGLWREDTLYDPARVEHDPDGATGDHHRVGAVDRPGTLEPDQLVSALRRGAFRGGSGVVFARSLFERAGGIDHRLRGGELPDLWCRAARAGARAEDHHGRVDVWVERQDIGRLPGRVHRIERALEPARGQELI